MRELQIQGEILSANLSAAEQFNADEIGLNWKSLASRQEFDTGFEGV